MYTMYTLNTEKIATCHLNSIVLYIPRAEDKESTMTDHKPDHSYRGLGDDYYDFGDRRVMNPDGLHVGPHGEVLILERKNHEQEILRDKGQKAMFQKMIQANPNIWVVYLITSIKVYEGRIVLQVDKAYRLYPDGNPRMLPILHFYAGNTKEVVNEFQAACREPANQNFRVVPDYGKHRKVS